MASRLHQAISTVLGCAAVLGAAPAAELPVPCTAGSCGPAAPATWVSAGSAGATFVGNTLTVRQTSPTAVLNWRSFNISEDGTVNFEQPDRSAIALNRIFDANPTRVLGALNANGQIYLLNQNGIVFREGAQVNVGGLVASSLNLSQQAVERGIAEAVNLGGSPAFQRYTDASGNRLPSGPVEVRPGATIDSPQGQVLLIAPAVTNRGAVRTPDGQAILAAGDNVYLATSNDPSLRGLFVEVRGDGTVTNGEAANAARPPEALVGRLVAERGNVTLAGLLVRQEGQVSATTSTRANGSIRLLARATTGAVSAGELRAQTVADKGGTLQLGQGSVTAVTLDATDEDETVDVNLQPRSSVQLSGRDIEIDERSRVTATAGAIQAYATERPSLPASQALRFQADSSRLVVASDAVLDVAGARVELPVERNVIRVELRGNQLADSPLQREGPLRSEPVFVDVRRSGTREDGSSWVGTPLADVSGDVANVRRGVAERNLDGGNIALNSTGTVLVGRGARLDVTGGVIDWQAGYVGTSRLLGEDGRVYDMAAADRDRRYLDVLDPREVVDPRWGVTSSVGLADPNAAGVYEPGYVEGRDAGSVAVAAPRLLFDGGVAGETTTGRYQRLDPATTQTDAHDRLPLGARLTIGLARTGSARDLVTPDVAFEPGFVLPGRLTLEDVDLIPPEALGSVRLRPDLLGSGRVANLVVYSNRSVTLPGAVSLVLPAGGSAAVTAGRIEIDGSISAPAGDIELSAGDTALFRGATPETSIALRLGPEASLTARGAWVNDDVRLNPPGSQPAPLYLDGGTVAASVTGGPLQLATGSVIDVSAGAQRRADGSIRSGRAGAITLAANTAVSARPASLDLGAELRGYALNRGGSLSIAADSVCITSGACDQGEPALTLAPEWFVGGGFGSIVLDARAGSLDVEDGTTVVLQQRNYELLSAAANAPTGTSMEAIATLTTLPDHLRRPMNLSLRSGIRTQDAGALQSELRLQPGSALLADPLASVSLVTDGTAVLEGLVEARGGRISVTIDATNRFGYRPDQGLWLGDRAVLDVSGTTQYEPNSAGLLTGRVLDGGSIALTARRGFVVTAPGSQLRAAGTAGDLDLRDPRGTFTRRTIATRGGQVEITAAEGALLNGAMQAPSGQPGTVEGGSLVVRLDGNARNAAPGFPFGDREILIAASDSPVIVSPGQPLPSGWLGRAALSSQRVADGGFDSLRLAASNLVEIDPVTGDASIGGYGRIVAADGVALHLPARLSLAASSVGLAAGARSATLGATYLTLTRDEYADPRAINALLLAAPASRPGSGALRLEGGFVDVLGSVTLDGVGTTTIRSEGDVRLSGVLLGSVARTYVGRLETAGDLTVEASQLYPTTLSNYTIALTGGDAGTLALRDVPGDPLAPLSAGASLTMIAPRIEVASAVRAPQGVIALHADSVTLSDGGLLSVSGDGQLVPFGTTQAELAWAYALGNDVTRIFGPDGEPLPDKRVTIEAPDIAVAAGALIDISGGGDLLGYEFVPGPGGTRDVLSAAVRPQQYAILPASNASVAHYDPGEAGSYLSLPGTAVWLAGGAGVSEGIYTLMPARFALLPGAFLVTAVDGFTDIAAGQEFATPLGGRIVAGAYAMAGTTLRDARTQGFEIRPGSSVQQEARYDLTGANEYFPVIDPTLGSSRLPRDSGTATLLAASSLSLEGRLRATGPDDGRGSTLEIAVPDLVVTANDGEALPEGAIGLSAERLNQLGAQTILLGGTARRGVDATEVDVRGDRIRVAGGAELVAPEVLLVARELLRVDAGATVAAQGSLSSSAADLALPAGAVLLRASVASQVEVSRSGGGTATDGRLELPVGSVVRAGGSITLDVDGSSITRGTLEVGDGSLGIGARRVALGDGPEGFDGVVVGADVLEAVQGELVLRSRSELVLYPGADVKLGALVVDAPQLVAGTATGVLRLAAERLALRGAATDDAPSRVGEAVLELSAGDLELRGGTTSLSGFALATISSAGLVDATGDGVLRTPGSLALDASLLTTAAATDFRFESGQALTLAVRPASEVLDVDASRRLGGGLQFTGDSVDGNLRVLLPGGNAGFVAGGGNLRLGGETRIDLAARATTFDGVTVAAPGGQLVLAAANGSIEVASGAVLDVSAADAAGAWAGSLTALAPGGEVTLAAELLGQSSAVGRGGDLTVVGQRIDLADLSSRLAVGGFDGAWDLQQLGPGDFAVASGESIRARSIRLVAEQGSVRIAGTLDARTPRGGLIEVAARGPIEIAGRLDASATDPDVRGGRIDLSSSTGLILARGSLLRVAGTPLADPEATPGGTVRLRAPRDAVLSVTDADPSNDRVTIAGGIEGARRVELEGTSSYRLDPGAVLGTDETTASPDNVWYADAAAFVEQRESVYAGLGVDSATLQVVPGIELNGAGDLELVADWNLFDWRFGPDREVGGVLTLRAAGDLRLNGSISDGFASALEHGLLDGDGASWSIRLAAGARPDGVDPLAVRTVVEAGDDGDVVVGPGAPGAFGQQRLVRTGTGDIDIAAARDVTFANAASVIYTAGEAGPGIGIPEDPVSGGLLELPYPVDAGDVRLRAGRDVVGGNASQLYTPWLLRSGGPASPLLAATAWTVDFGAFEQGVAAFGGGRVDVAAGRDVRDLSVALPSIGRQVGGTEAVDSELQIVGSGDLTVVAGRDVLGGQFLVDGGRGRIAARGAVGESAASRLAPILAVGDADLSVTARRSLGIVTTLNPTLLWPVDYNGGSPPPAYFATYAPGSRVDLVAAGGDLAIGTGADLAERLAAQYPLYFWNVEDARNAVTIMAPTMTAAAQVGGLEVGRPMSLWPAPRGNLQLLARGDLDLQSVVMSDAAVGLTLPTPAAPGSDASLFTFLFSGSSSDPRFNAPMPVHGPSADDPLGDLEPARLVSLEGDIRGPGGGVSTPVYIPKALRVSAGRDIGALSLTVQHFSEALVSTIEAGRDFFFPSERDSVGSLRNNLAAVLVDGPGVVEFVVGRDFDLQTSRGVVTRGDIRNPALPDGGASVAVTAGLAGGQPDYEAFIERYLVSDDTYDALLLAYVARITGTTPVGKVQALQDFAQFDRAQQRQLLQTVLFGELRAGGRSAAQPGDQNGDFGRAFTALETYFPGGNPDVDGGEANAYEGDIRLFFSRVYTLDGGSIELLAPGGEINVGLASPPVAFGLRKEPSDLGLVVQSTGSVAALAYTDFQVNESRTFAADGGDILVWSTRGDIDAGRGAKTAISAPPPVITIDSNGQVVLTYPAALSGSGIQTLATSPGREPGDVDLFAPRGVVDAGDAGIVAGNLTIAATAVLGANNIQVSGAAVGVPVDSGGLGASLTGVSSVGSAATAAAETAVAPGGGAGSSTTDDGLGESALSWLDVFVIGLGEEQCDPKDVECLRRQKKDQ